LSTYAVDIGQIRHRISIGGVDYSAQLDSYELSDSHIDQGGLVKCTGKIDFTKGAISIDNWGLSAIADGTTVTIDVFIGGIWQRHPRGALRSVGSTYSEPEEKLEVEVGCILSARSFAEVPDVFLSGVTPGSSVGVQTVAMRLFNNGGIATVVNNAAGAFSFLDRPQMSGSAIETAGKMLASAGAIAWVDSQERVQTANLTLDPPVRIWAGHACELASFERTKVGQPPTEEIKVSGSYREIHIQKTPVIVGPIREYGPSKFGGTELLKETTTTTTIDFGGARETAVTVSKINANIVYRAWNAGGNGLVPDAEVSTRIRVFDKNDTGYLLSNTETVSKERGLAIGPYLDWLHKNDPSAFSGSSRYGAVPTEKKEELYTYNSNGFLIRKETTTWDTLCNLLGELGDPEWKLAANLDLAQIVPVEKLIETWEEKIPGQWIAYTETYMAQSRAPKGRTGIVAAIDTQKSSAEYLEAINQGKQLISVTGRKPVDSNSGQSTPPEPERIPAQFRSESSSTESIAHFPGNASNWQPRRSDMQTPYLPDRQAGSAPPTEFCQYYGKIYGGIQQAQWRTARFTLPLTQWLIDGYKPWGAIDVIRQGTVYTLAISGSSWAGDQEQCLVSIDGALLGERVGVVITNDVITTPGVLQPPYNSKGEPDVVTAVAASSSNESENSYGDYDLITATTASSDVVIIEDITTSITGSSDLVVADDNNDWIWFF
jgi:hypothetical protein